MIMPFRSAGRIARHSVEGSGAVTREALVHSSADRSVFFCPHLTDTHGIGRLSTVVVLLPPCATTPKPKRGSMPPCDMQTSR